MRVALTGPDGDRGSLGEGLRALGVDTVDASLLRVEVLDVRLDVRGYDLLAFASPRAVEAAATLLGGLAPGAPCIVVGPETARRARDARFTVLVEGTGPGAAGLLGAAKRAEVRLDGKRILLPGSDRARPELAEGLRRLGADVEPVAVYALHPRERAGPLPAADAILVASPSAAERLAGMDGLLPLVALGPTTAEAMEALGLRAEAVAATPTAEGIMEVLRKVTGDRP